LTETVKFVAVVPAVKVPSGERESQLSAVQLCSDTAAVALVLLCAVTVRVWFAGVDPPATAVNERLVALRVSDPGVLAAITSRVIVQISEPSLTVLTVTVSL